MRSRPGRGARNSTLITAQASTREERLSRPSTREDEGESELQILFHGTGKVWLDDLSLKAAR